MPVDYLPNPPLIHVNSVLSNSFLDVWESIWLAETVGDVHETATKVAPDKINAVVCRWSCYDQRSIISTN